MVVRSRRHILFEIRIGPNFEILERKLQIRGWDRAQKRGKLFSTCQSRVFLQPPFLQVTPCQLNCGGGLFFEAYAGCLPIVKRSRRITACHRQTIFVQIVQLHWTHVRTHDLTPIVKLNKELDSSIRVCSLNMPAAFEVANAAGPIPQRNSL
jgi:hypothetical protein